MQAICSDRLLAYACITSTIYIQTCHIHTYSVISIHTLQYCTLHTNKQVWSCTCLHYTHEHTYTHRGIMYARTRMYIHTFVNTLVKFGEFMSIKQTAKLNLNQKQNVRNGQIVRSGNQIPFRTKQKWKRVTSIKPI